MTQVSREALDALQDQAQKQIADGAEPQGVVTWLMSAVQDALAAQGGVKVKELERQVEIEKAGLAISKLDPSDLDEGSWKVEAEAALEAVGYFDLRAKLDALVEAGEAAKDAIDSLERDAFGEVTCWQTGGPLYPLRDELSDRLGAALSAAKEQSHD